MTARRPLALDVVARPASPVFGGEMAPLEAGGGGGGGGGTGVAAALQLTAIWVWPTAAPAVAVIVAVPPELAGAV